VNGRIIDADSHTSMFGSGWPHAEGVADPAGGYPRHTRELCAEAESKLYGGSAEWLIGR
jgi:hypothetical protein